SASSDATSGLAGYDILVDGTIAGTVAAPATSWTASPAIAGGTHTWGVVARDNFGLTRASTPASMSVRIDAAPPTVAFATPTASGFTNDTTPTLTWTAADDSCLARIEVTVDGAVVAMLTGTAPNWTPTSALAEGAHTWSLRAFDSAGKVTSTPAPRTFTIDTTAPTAVTAVSPANLGSTPEGMLTFSWTTGADGTGSGVDHYDLSVDGNVVATNVSATSSGTYSIYPGAHVWSVRAYDAVGNSATFPFSYTATAVPDTTPPDTFNLLTPADAAPVTAGFNLTWQPAWDFHGIAQYRVFIDGALAGTTAGTVTQFTPSASGAAICTVDYDPSTSSGCITGPTFTNGKATGSAAVLPSPASTTWNSAAQAGWSASGNAYGFGDASVTPITAAAAGFDGDRVWTAAEYSASVPAAGADLRFEHRYRTHMVGQNGYDGGTVEIKVDTTGNGFADDLWQTTCAVGSLAIYGSTMRCDQQIVEVDGGYNAVLVGASATAQPLWHQHAFSGTSPGMVQTKIHLTKFAGKNIQFRFRLGTDSCYSGMPTTQANYCTTNGAGNWGRAVWRIDNVTLAEPQMLPGPHTWYVEARDPAGNSRPSNQTWSFNLS
ncbi:MAG: Transrane protein, partial [Thermoleophilia bacterium]|nr:Transrane protein [Thermoleophilia bacterium]